jgi:DNA invertase Pin-like site-specific DNA recombinase
MIAHFEEIDENTVYDYARVSSKEQADNSSFESQKKELIRQGVRQKNVFVEVGSATDLINKRPVFSKLINETLKTDDSLVVSKLDRSSRNTLSFL